MISKLVRPSTILLVALLAAGCVSSVLDIDGKATQPIPSKLVGEMSRKNMSILSPILIRIFKEESELEIWKRDKSGKFALLKIYPMCRWSGKLGPKKKNGDRQAPEGFYHVSADMLNPNSQYYLSFNLGYPNRLEAALGYTGEALMVHGACSSSGCFALTDQGVAEIYAVAREALKGEQKSFQVQAYPFRMTAENMARNRTDTNFSFWADLKKGYDIFETSRRQPKVSYCGGRYVFDTDLGNDTGDPLATCPISLPDTAFTVPVSGVESPLSGQISPVHSYIDGGMHPVFRKVLTVKGEKALSRQTSRTQVPISKPAAALADPHSPGD